MKTRDVDFSTFSTSILLFAPLVLQLCVGLFTDAKYIREKNKHTPGETEEVGGFGGLPPAESNQ
jgi:hypothetical protein